MLCAAIVCESILHIRNQMFIQNRVERSLQWNPKALPGSIFVCRTLCYEIFQSLVMYIVGCLILCTFKANKNSFTFGISIEFSVSQSRESHGLTIYFGKNVEHKWENPYVALFPHLKKKKKRSEIPSNYMNILYLSVS